MNRTYGYARVSSDEQKQSGLGMEAQHDAIVAFVDYRAKGEPLPEWGGMTDDAGVSGALAFLRRPGGKRLHAKLEKGDNLIFHKLDRGFRDLEDTIKMMNLWRSMGVVVHILNLGGGGSVDMSTPFGQFMLHVMAAIAQLERGMIAERMRAAIARIKARGGSMNRVAPPGFRIRKGKMVLVNEEHVRFVRSMGRLLDSGETYNGLARQMATTPVPWDKKGTWSRWRVRTIHRQYRKYKGLYESKSSEVAAAPTA